MSDYKQIRQRFLMVRANEASPDPWGSLATLLKSIVKEDVLSFICSCLVEDRVEGLKKQKHTARKIYDCLVEEKGFRGRESKVRRAVRDIRGKMPKAFIPLQFDPADCRCHAGRLGYGNSLPE